MWNPVSGSVSGSISSAISACQRAFASLVGHLPGEPVEVVDLEVGKQVLAAQEDRIVACTGRAQVGEELGPDRFVTAAVLRLATGQHPHREPDAFRSAHGRAAHELCRAGGGHVGIGRGRLDQLDAGTTDALDEARWGGRIGHDPGDPVGPAERREHRPTPLGVVDDAGHLDRSGYHRPLDLRLLLGRVGQSRLDREAGRAEERAGDVDAPEEPVAPRTDDRQRLPAHAAARHQDRDPVLPGELFGDPDPVRDHGQLPPAADLTQPARDLECRRAGVERDRLAVVDEVGCRRRDAPLRIGFDALADVERQLGSVRRRRDRAAVRPGQPVRPLEREQVLADRLLRDVEPLGEFRDEDAAVLLDHPVDLLLPFLREHWRPWASNDDCAHPNARSRDDEQCGCECVAAMLTWRHDRT